MEYQSELDNAIGEYERAESMFNYASCDFDTDVAIILMNAATLKIKALRKVVTKYSKPDPQPETLTLLSKLFGYFKNKK